MKTKLQIILLLSIAALAAVIAQGPLTPPSGTPAPVMKTLDQVEPRIPINLDLSVSNCALVGINAPRGALLERCRVWQNPGNGIWAKTGGTLIHGTAQRNTGNGIVTEGGCTLIACAAVLNTSAGTGIKVGSGSTLSNCTAMDNSFSVVPSFGIWTDRDCTIPGCTSSSNVSLQLPGGIDFGGGINAAAESTLRDCTVFGNTGAGIAAGNYCTISNCTISQSNIYGLYADARCTVTDCTVSRTTATGIGIRVGDKSSITGCTASDNPGDGIQLTSRSKAIENNASLNTGNGIHAFGSLNRIDGNHATGNGGAGIRSEGGDFTVRNTVNGNAGGNLVPAPAAGTNVAPLQQAFSATNPWANLQ